MKNTVYKTRFNANWSVPVLYKGNEMWCSYDDPQSIAIKGEWALERGMGGIMHWQVRGDNGTLDLQKACWKAMNKQAHLHYSHGVRTIILTDTLGQITDTAVVTLQSSSSDIVTRVLCPVGFEFPIAAEALTDGTFLGWSDGEMAAERTIIAEDGMTLTAHFATTRLGEVKKAVPTAIKIFRNGHLYLKRENMLYDVLGSQIK